MNYKFIALKQIRFFATEFYIIAVNVTVMHNCTKANVVQGLLTENSRLVRYDEIAKIWIALKQNSGNFVEAILIFL